MGRLVALALLGSAACGPVPPASERVPVSGGMETSVGDEGTRPGSDAPIHDDGETADDGPKLDQPVGDDGSCEQTFDIEPLPSAIEVVVDASQGMANQLVDHDGDASTPEITRWAMLAPALAEFLPALADGADIDVHVFPHPDAPNPPDPDACTVGAAPGLGTPVEDLLLELPAPDSTSMLGANPGAFAYQSALDHLQWFDLQRKRAIVLVADSAPNCTEGAFGVDLFDQVDDRVRALAEYAQTLDVRTYVVLLAVAEGEWGGAGGDPLAYHYEVLQGIANAGGTAPMIADRSDQLATVLAELVGKTRSCRARLPAGVQVGTFGLQAGGVDFYEIGGFECTGSDGFVYVDNGLYDTIELCASACTNFLADEIATIVVFCPFAE